MNFNEVYEKELAFQSDRRKSTVAFIKIINDLWYDNAVEIVLFRNRLVNKNVSEILNLHEYAEEFVQKPISIFDSVEIAKAIKLMDLPPSKIDIGKLTFEYHSDGDEYGSLNRFVQNKLKEAKTISPITPKNVILFGFGRIGRLVARELMTITGKGSQLRLRAIVTRDHITEETLRKRASLLKSDSVHGDFEGTVEINTSNNSLVINGTTVHMISGENPEAVDYTKYGIDNALLIDNTGIYRDKESLGKHLKSKGVTKVLLSAPGDEIPNIVHGVNHMKFDPDSTHIYSAASCTTNAITPVLKTIDDTLGIQNGHIETIHAYTNDQNLVDNMHPKYRRGRAAALNMVITETGAGKAVAKILPQLKGKLTANAIRVPVPNGSLVILKLNLKKKTTKKQLNAIIRKNALEGELVEQIKYSLDNELVSCDVIGSSAPSIYDSNATIVNQQGSSVVLYIWYDNECAYSHQIIRLSKYISKVRRFTYY